MSPRSKFSSGLGTTSALVAGICTGLCQSRCHSQARFRLPKDPRRLTDLGADLGAAEVDRLITIVAVAARPGRTGSLSCPPNTTPANPADVRVSHGSGSATTCSHRPLPTPAGRTSPLALAGFHPRSPLRDFIPARIPDCRVEYVDRGFV